MDCRATPLKLLVSEVMQCIAQMLPVSCWPSTPLCVFASLQTPGGFCYMGQGGWQKGM